MITIFVLLGLVFLGGGAYAIIDGWPYLVLERGFTQVIIGTVAVTGGVLLLALSRVLAELRRMKTTVTGAMMALSTAQLLAEEPPRQASVESAAPEPFRGGQAPGSGAILAGAGVAAAGTVLVASQAAAAAEPQPEADMPAEGDRFALPPLPPEKQDFAESDAAVTPLTFADPGPVSDPEPPVEPAWSDAPPAFVEPAPALEPSHDLQPRPADTTPDVAPDAITAAINAAFEQTPPPAEDRDTREGDRSIDAPADESEPTDEPKIWWPTVDTPRGQATEADRLDPDDFGALRQDLALARPFDGQPGAPEASAPWDAGDLDRTETAMSAAEAWMEPVAGRREPVFGEPNGADASEAPRWPPLTTQSHPTPTEAEDQSGSAAWAEPTAEAIPPSPSDVSGPWPASEERPADPESTAIAEPASLAEPRVEEPQPAASEEGVVGAYQVGDTHFTMYADGSIRARTPDDDYSFASMDELKTYLASEKSRLGV